MFKEVPIHIENSGMACMLLIAEFSTPEIQEYAGFTMHCKSIVARVNGQAILAGHKLNVKTKELSKEIVLVVYGTQPIVRENRNIEYTVRYLQDEMRRSQIEATGNGRVTFNTKFRIPDESAGFAFLA